MLNLFFVTFIRLKLPIHEICTGKIQQISEMYAVRAIVSNSNNISFPKSHDYHTREFMYIYRYVNKQ